MLVYAIDFGTTNSLLAAADAERVYEPIGLDSDAADPSILRSILYFPTMKECFYGARAMQEFAARDMEGRLIRSIKKFLPVRSFIGTYVEDRPMNLEDIIGLFLREMRARANRHFKEDVDRVVIGRPARFSPDETDDQFAQYRLERAAKIAGFKHIEFCAEPVAAAREFRTSSSGPNTILVCDFGGGTSDFTVSRDSEVLAIGGVSVAGDALDGAVMRHRISRHFGAGVKYQVPFGSNILTMPTHLMEKICSPADISLLRKRDTMEFFRNVREWSLGEKDRKKMDSLFSLLDDQLGFSVFEEIERTKRGLSESTSARFEFTYPEIEIKEEIKREQFDEYTSEQIARVLKALDETIVSAQVKPEQIDLVCCTGGTAKVSALHEALIRRFGAPKIRQHKNFHSVVQGLGERARDLARA